MNRAEMRAEMKSMLAQGAPTTQACVIAAANTSVLLKARADVVCDGTDDHVEINAALSAQKRLILLPGNYGGGKMSIPSDIWLEAYGATYTQKAGETDYVLTNSDYAGGNTGIFVYGLKIVGNGTAITSAFFQKLVDSTVLDVKINGGRIDADGRACLYLDDCERNWIEDCEFYNHRLGLWLLTDCLNNYVLNNYVHGCRTGIYLFQGSNHNLIQGNNCSDGIDSGAGADGILFGDHASNYNRVIGNKCCKNGEHGMYIGADSNYTSIVGNECSENGGNGIQIHSSNSMRGTVVTDNVCEGNTGNGIFVGFNAFDSVISGNYCRNNGGSGIYHNNLSSRNTIVGNSCHKNAESGINAWGSFLNVADNICRENTHYGIYLYSGQGVVAKGNQCILNARDGIYVSGVSDSILEGNICVDNDSGDTGAFSGIDFVGACLRNLISGNRCYNTVPAVGQVYGINISQAECDGNVLINNRVENNKVGGVADSGTSTVVRGLPAFITKNDNYTVKLEDSDVAFAIATDAKIFTLPATKKGLIYTFTNTGADGNNAVTISPQATDAIHGAGLTSVDNKDLINTKATAKEGDFVTLVGDGDAGWWIVGIQGTWAKEA